MKSIDEIAYPYREVFSSFKTFNSIQSKVFNDVYQTDKSIIISSPTGSGKTVIFELAIIRLIQTFQEYEDFKMVYVAPIKALCAERYSDWSEKFRKIGMKCLEVTGDGDIQDLSELCNAKLIITTPEKWDSLTRKWRDHEHIVAAIKLFMIDEVHLLNEDVRGPILETVVSRMKTIQYSMRISGNELNLRFICASATIPNIIDLTEWIGGKNWRNNTVSHFFGENERPVNLEKHILGFNTSIASFKFDMSLNYKLAPIIRKYSSGKPSLIFCSSRKSVEMASAVLQKEPCLFALSDSHKSLLIQLIKEVKEQKLASLIIKGIAYHHAGLVYEDRNLIEAAFRKGLLLALVCTNTLAMGVNLPAHLVIIKSTEIYINGKMIEYTKSSVLQMIGRAGRPQYDVNGVAVIMTQQKYVKKYENLMNGATPVESHLHKHLAEHLNSEIVLQTITDLDIAMEWIRSTFLYVRACKSPNNYGLPSGITKQKIEKKLEEMSLIAINSLETNELITKDQVYGLSLKATTSGRLMARYYLSLETMKLFRKISGNENYLEIFNTIIKCKEFSEFTLRVNEKKILNDLNDEPIRYPIGGKIKTNENKISCLVQANFGNLTIQDPSMSQDSIKMMRLGDRIAKALVEYLHFSKSSSTNGSYKSLLHAVMISKCYRAKLWEDSEFICKQLKKIGSTYSSLLVKAGKTTLKAILDTDAQTLEMILHKPPPFGTEILAGLSKFPNYDLKLGYSNNFLNIKVTQNNEKYNGKYNCTLIIGNSDNQLLMYCDEIDAVIRRNGIFERTFKIINSNVRSITANLIHDTLVGADKTISLTLNPDEPDTENTEPKITKKSNPRKRKIQTKLNFSKNSKKTKSNENLEEYESLLGEDDILFTTISSQAILQENNSRNLNDYEDKNSVAKTSTLQNNYGPPCNNLFNQNGGSLKRKLSKFEYNIKSKLPRNNTPISNSFEPNDFPDYNLGNDEIYDVENLMLKKIEEHKKSNNYASYTSSESANQMKDLDPQARVVKNFVPLVTQQKVLSSYNQSTGKSTDINRLIQTNRQNNPYHCSKLTETTKNQNFHISSESNLMSSVIDLTKNTEKINFNNISKANHVVDLTIERTTNFNAIDLVQSEPLDFSLNKPVSGQKPFENSNCNNNPHFNERLQNRSLIPSSSNVRYQPYPRYSDEKQNYQIVGCQQSNKIDYNYSHKNSNNKDTDLTDMLMNDDDLFHNISTQRALEEKQSSSLSPKVSSLSRLNLIDNFMPFQNTSQAVSGKRQFQNISNNIPEKTKPSFLPRGLNNDDKNKLTNIENRQTFSEGKKTSNLLPSNLFNFQRNETNNPQISSMRYLKNMGNILKPRDSNVDMLANKNPKRNWANLFSDYSTNANNRFQSSSAFQPKCLGMTRIKKLIGSNISKPENIFGSNQKQCLSSDLKTDFKTARAYYNEIKDDDGLMPPLDDCFDSGISQCNSIDEHKTTKDIELLAEDEETEKLLYNCSEEIDLSIDLINNKNENNWSKPTNALIQISQRDLTKEPQELHTSLEKNLSSSANSISASQENLNKNTYIIFNHDINKSLKQADINYGNIILSKPKIVKDMDILDILTQICDGNLFENLNIPTDFEKLDVAATIQEVNPNKFKDFFEEDTAVDTNVNSKRSFRIPDIPNYQEMMSLTSTDNNKPMKEVCRNITEKNNNFIPNQKSLYDEIVDKGLANLNSKMQRNYFKSPLLNPMSTVVNQSTRKKGFVIRNDSNISKTYLIDSDADRTIGAEILKTKFYQDSSYDEANYTKDLITCLISDRGSRTQDLNLTKNRNESLFKFTQNDASTLDFPEFRASQTEPVLENNRILIEDDELNSFGEFPECLNDMTEAEYYDNLSNEYLVDQNESVTPSSNNQLDSILNL